MNFCFGQRASGDFVTRNDVLFVQKEIKNTVQSQTNAKYSEKMSSNPDILGKAIATWWFKKTSDTGIEMMTTLEPSGPAVRFNADVVPNTAGKELGSLNRSSALQHSPRKDVSLKTASGS